MKVSSPIKEYPKDYETLLKEYKELQIRYEMIKNDLNKLLIQIGAK